MSAVLKNAWNSFVDVIKRLTGKPYMLTVMIIFSFILFFCIGNKWGFRNISVEIKHDLSYADSCRDSIVTAHANFNSCTKALANQYQYFKRFKKQHIRIATEYEIYYYCFVMIMIIATVMSTFLIVLVARKGWDSQTPYMKAAVAGFLFSATITGVFMNVFNNEGNVGNNMSKYFYFTNLQTNIYNALAIDSLLDKSCKDSSGLVRLFNENNKNLKENLNLFMDIKADKNPCYTGFEIRSEIIFVTPKNKPDEKDPLCCMPFINSPTIRHSSPGKPAKNQPQKKETVVYICDSKTAYAYHTSTSCRGLKRCTHQLVKMTETDAKAMKRTPCKVCH